jgi:ADP-ribose pyrophosphatase
MHVTKRSKLIYKSKWLNIYEDFVYKNNGKTARFSRFEIPDIVIIVPIFKDGSVLMLKSFRHGVGKMIFDLPGGFVENNESFLTSAKRELLEETGYTCSSLKEKGWFYSTPSRSKQKFHVFIARGLKRVTSQKLDEFEYIRLVKITEKQLVKKLKDGKINHGHVLASLMLTGF